MKSVVDLDLGSVDAVNYQTRNQKEFFSKILYREQYLDEILSEQKYFLIGEKGTGKTSYATFLNNNDYKDTLSNVVSLTQTDYRRFVSLNDQGKFPSSSYVDIWKVTLLLLLSTSVTDNFDAKVLGYPKFNLLNDIVNRYYHSAFRREVDQSLDFIEQADVTARMMSDEAGDELANSPSAATFTVNLGYLERKFKEAVATLKLEKDFILFIDGIDIRPDQIEYNSYIDCIRGLANAVWELNTSFFANIKDSKKHFKVVLLMRPDILDNMGFQNLNAKVRDNGVVLNWSTSYDLFKSSALFKLVVGTMSKQQDVHGKSEMDVWQHYFPYDLDNLRLAEVVDDPFVGLLRYSFYRPRDIVQYLKLMQDYVVKSEENKNVFSKESFFSAQGEFSDYLLGEVKDYLSFYHSTVDFDEVVGFFAELGGKNNFSWDIFKSAFARHKERLQEKHITIKELTSSPEEFLQFLYALNIVGYLEPDNFGGNFVHYCFRDRTTVKLRPKVRFGLTYHVHPGLQRALLVGGEMRSRHKPRRRTARRTRPQESRTN